MDKDYIILKHGQQEIEDMKDRAKEFRDNQNKIDRFLKEVQDKINDLGIDSGLHVNEKQIDKLDVHVKTEPVILMTYDQIYEVAKTSIEKRGLDPEEISYVDLLSAAEVREIEHELNALLPREEKWVKNDFVVVFIAALIGSAADLIFGNRNNQVTGQGTEFAKELNNKFHNHKPHAPIDYQGEGFGGPEHRLKGKGHDILRFFEGIEMFKKGQFEGRYHLGHGKIVETVIKANQYGMPYEQLSTINAIITYAQHMFGDLFSSYSLPFPGYSFIMDSDNRGLRKLTIEMYRGGFNCKNIIIQSISTISIEVILRMYYGIIAVKDMRADVEIADDFSNYDQIKQFFLPEKKDKLMEMLLLCHSIVTAINIGKITITKRVEQINVTEIMAVIRYGISVLKTTWNRNDEYSKLIRNADLISGRWEEIETDVFETQIIELLEEKEPLLIG